MENDLLQTTSFPSQQDPIKRVACIRCRTQKLKCIKSTHASVTSRCDRCRKADVECTYAASKPMGRPRTARSRQANQIPQSPTSQSDKTTTPQPCELPHDPIDFDTIIDDVNPALDAQNMNMFFDHMSPFEHHSDISTSQGLALPAGDIEFLTPCSSQSSLPFSNPFDAYIFPVPLEDEATDQHVRTTTSACVSEDPQRSSMQHLAKIGLDLYAQVTKYQKAGDCIILADLVRDVLHSSTNYLNRLLSLDGNFVIKSQEQEQLHCKAGLEWTDGQSCNLKPQQLDMSAAFQLLIPYVRLVQLHNILYRALLRCLNSSSSNNKSNNGSSSNSNGGSSRSGSIATSSAAAGQASNFPNLSVGGMSIDAGDPLRARLLLQMNVYLLAEIETTLELPHEARICCSEHEGGIGSAIDVMSAKEHGTTVLRKSVSPRLLKTILDERNMGGDDVQSMRDRIAYIKCLLRHSMLQA